MTKIRRGAELLWLMGIIFVAMGVALCSKADLGVSMVAAPAFVLFDALHPLWDGFSVGMVEYMVQFFMLALLCLVVRRFSWRYLPAFLVAVCYGYVLDFFLWLFGAGSPASLFGRWCLLVLGDVTVAFGVACFFRTYMPLQVYELFVAELCRVYRLPLAKTKQIFDITLLCLSVLLILVLFRDIRLSDLAASSIHHMGLGTLVTTVINSPLIALTGKGIDKLFDAEPRFPRWESLLKRK